METIEQFMQRRGRGAAEIAWGQRFNRRRVAYARRAFAQFSVARGGGRNPYIFTRQESSAKGRHNADFTDKFYEIIHYGAAARSSGVLNMCTSSTRGCRGVCLFHSGQLGLPAGQLACVIRTQFLYDQPRLFFLLWFAECEAHDKRARDAGMRLVVRGNGTTDMRLEDFMPSEYFVRFLNSDYTKHYDRASRPHRNYHVVKSAKETVPMPVGENVVVPVFIKRGEPLPKRFEGRRVIDGDVHDLRFLDRPRTGAAVLVRAKGRAMRDTSGFVRSV